jgi:quinohemoprotein ethanol dehydrogenase
MAFDPNLGLMFIPAMRGPFTYQDDPKWTFVRGRWNLAQQGAFGRTERPPPAKLSPAGEAALAKMPPAGGFLIAWDPVTQSARWVVQQETSWNGGALATGSGLVFAGADKTFNAYDARTGEKLWSDATAAVVMAGPATYEIDGQQYIAVTVGYGGSNAVIGGRYPRRPGRVYVYRLGGGVKALDFPAFAPNPQLDPTRVVASSGDAAKGGQLVADWCLSCHVGGIFIPDLTRSPRITTPELFRDVVHGGTLRPRGMASFAQWLNEQDVEDIRAYWLQQAAAAQKAAAEAAVN